MREIEIDQKKLNIRPLTRREVKELKAKGLNLLKIDPSDPDTAIDAVLQMQFGADMVSTIDEMPYQDASKIFVAIMKETFGAPDEEKN